MVRTRRAVRGVIAAVVAAIASAGLGAHPAAARDGRRIALEKIASVPATTAMAVRSGDPALYVTTQDGQVLALRSGQEPQVVLDITSRVRAGGERGLLGLAFSPDGSRLYVHYSGAAAGETVLEEYAFNGAADPSTARTVLTLPQPQANHNGGEVTFGPDGMLYLGLGDGGSGGDQGPGHAPGGNGQSLGTLLGKILRIDPRPSAGRAYTIPPDNPYVGTSSRPEILVYGLRNPWRFSFDTKTGDLWVGDVGQSSWEEATRIPAGEIAGANLGWNLFEGNHPYRAGGDEQAVVMPVVETSHADGNCSITGGYVYRGTKIPSLRGWYLYTDYCNGAIRAVKVSSGGVKQRDLGLDLPSVASFGQDAAGELYVLSQQSGVYRLVPRPSG